jgi:hypothetical protein
MNNKIITKTKKCGCFSTKLQNKYHSINDVPSFKACEIHKIEEDKAILNWYKNGKLHREEGPSAIFLNNDEEWYYEGKLHRVGGPAINYKNQKEWLIKGKHHRIGGPAVEFNNGDKAWFRHGKRHRLNAPAYIYNYGDIEFYRFGNITYKKSGDNLIYYKK